MDNKEIVILAGKKTTGGSVTPASIVTATGQMTPEQAVRTRENLGAESMESITYSALKTLRDSGNLVPGKQYRITDYVCTVANDSEARAVSHPYDIIVTADDASTLNENARACLHSGDTYYSANDCKADLSAWELKYCIDNDTDRFAWADATNGKGVVFWLKDDWSNECPYDFKQIQFKRYKITACTKSPNLVDTYLAASEVSGDITADLTDFIWAYTFSGVLDESVIDTSVYNWMYSDGDSTYHCYDNTIKTLMNDNGGIKLNNIVFLVSGIPCRSNTFGNDCWSNTFGNDCRSNTFGNDCWYNTFGNNCRSNTFGNDCGSNTFGNDCRSNTFGNDCWYNTFGNDCRSNTFGNDCGYNTFATASGGSTAQNYYRHIALEDGVQYLVLYQATTSSTAYVQNYHVLNGLQGTRKSKINVDANTGLAYCTFVGKNTSGVVKTWNPMDAAT